MNFFGNNNADILARLETLEQRQNSEIAELKQLVAELKPMVAELKRQNEYAESSQDAENAELRRHITLLEGLNSKLQDDNALLMEKLKVPTAEEKRDKLIGEITEMLEKRNIQLSSQSYIPKTLEYYGIKYHKTFSEYFLKRFAKYQHEFHSSFIAYYCEFPKNPQQVENWSIRLDRLKDLRGIKAKYLVEFPSYNFDYIEFIKQLDCYQIAVEWGNINMEHYIKTVLMDFATSQRDYIYDNYIMPTLPNESEIEYEVRILEYIKSYIKKPYEEFVIMKSLNL